MLSRRLYGAAVGSSVRPAGWVGRGLAKTKKPGKSALGMLKQKASVDKAKRDEQAESRVNQSTMVRPFLKFKSMVPAMIKYLDDQEKPNAGTVDPRTDEEKAQDMAIAKEHSRVEVKAHYEWENQMNRIMTSKWKALDAIPEGYLKEHAMTWDMSQPPYRPVVTMDPPDPEVPERIQILKTLKQFYDRDFGLVDALKKQTAASSAGEAAGADSGEAKGKKGKKAAKAKTAEA